jgi:hypothetical protein
MILTEYYNRTGGTPPDLGNDGVGLTGVGAELMDELFTLPLGLDPALEAAIEEFASTKRKAEAKLKKLEVKAEAGGVKGMAAANEIKQIETADTTNMNRIELTLAAAKRKGAKKSGETALNEKKAVVEKAAKAEKQASKDRLKARMAAFGGGN